MFLEGERERNFLFIGDGASNTCMCVQVSCPTSAKPDLKPGLSGETQVLFLLVYSLLCVDDGVFSPEFPF